MGEREHGVTVIELLITVTVVATIAAIAVPAWRSIAAYGRGAAELNRLAADLAYARAAAIARGEPVSLCTSSDGSACSKTPWDDGWIVYLDTDADLARDPGETILRAEDGFASADRLAGNRLVAHHLGFRRDGLLLGLHNGTITFTPVPDRSALRRCLVISRTGRVRAVNGADCP